MTRILMVCLGNICRSPLAEGILSSKLDLQNFDVDSAGTGSYHIGEQPDQRSIAVARKNGIDISGQRARQFDVADFDHFHFIYVMDESNYTDVIKLSRGIEDMNKVNLILEALEDQNPTEVPDPYYGGHDGFEHVFQLLDKACDAIASQLKASRV